jgi:hypothetical protein
MKLNFNDIPSTISMSVNRWDTAFEYHGVIRVKRDDHYETHTTLGLWVTDGMPVPMIEMYAEDVV